MLVEDIRMIVCLDTQVVQSSILRLKRVFARLLGGEPRLRLFDARLRGLAGFRLNRKVLEGILVDDLLLGYLKLLGVAHQVFLLLEDRPLLYFELNATVSLLVVKILPVFHERKVKTDVLRLIAGDVRRLAVLTQQTDIHFFKAVIACCFNFLRFFVGIARDGSHKGSSLSQFFLCFMLIDLLVKSDYKVVLKLLKELFSFEGARQWRSLGLLEVDDAGDDGSEGSLIVLLVGAGKLEVNFCAEVVLLSRGRDTLVVPQLK